MAFTLQDVLNARSAAQILNEWLAYLASPPDGLPRLRTTNWRTGGPYLYLIRRYSQELESLYKLVASLGGSAFIRYATGLWLRWLGEDFFGEPFQGASFATTNVTLTSSPGFGPYGPQFVKVKATNGKTYTSINLVTIPLGSAVTAAFRADSNGTGSNVGAGEINALVSPNVLGVAVTNAAAVVDGLDEEDETRYKSKLLDKWGILSAGVTVDSSFAMVEAGFKYLAMRASLEVKKVAVLSSFNSTTGMAASNTTSVILAGYGTGVTGGAVADVLAVLQPRIGLDEVLIVETAITVTLGMQGTIKVRSAYFAAGLGPIADSYAALDKRTPIGGGPAGVPVSEFVAAAFYDPLAVYDATFTNPISPVSLSYKQLLVTDPSALVLQQVP